MIVAALVVCIGKRGLERFPQVGNVVLTTVGHEKIERSREIVHHGHAIKRLGHRRHDSELFFESGQNFAARFASDSFVEKAKDRKWIHFGEYAAVKLWQVHTLRIKSLFNFGNKFCLTVFIVLKNVGELAVVARPAFVVCICHLRILWRRF